MATYAPERPTTSTLRERHPATPEQLETTAAMRSRVSRVIGGQSLDLLVVVGPCAMTLDREIAISESGQLAELSTPDSGIVGVYRDPFWKPRTRPEDWFGLETTDPDAAYETLVALATTNGNAASEIGHIPHLERYAELLALAWKGGRAFDSNENAKLTEAMALHNPDIPVAVKNGLDGEVDDALNDIATILRLRQGMGAGAVLLYRGGKNATTPETWEKQYLRAHEQTDGQLIVDWAHGGEQAHDPEGKFGKSVIGQIACMNHFIEIVERTGQAPIGILAEASSAKSPTDPVMPFDAALEGAVRLAKIKKSLGT